MLTGTRFSLSKGIGQFKRSVLKFSLIFLDQVIWFKMHIVSVSHFVTFYKIYWKETFILQSD